MASQPHRLPSNRAKRLERKLRARAARLKAPEQLKSRAMPVGLCHACATIVYAGDSLAMAGIYLLHADCCAPAADSAERPQDETAALRAQRWSQM